MRIGPCICVALIAATPLHAQDAAEAERDRSFLTGLIEDALSGDGQTVRLDGFRGALSATARFDQLTISDDQGPWLTLTDGAVKWDRAALLAGAIDIDTLTVASIDLPRLPASDKAPATASTEFRLPELPVSLSLGELRVDKAILGAPILGQAATLGIAGSAALSGGEGQANLALDRLDGPDGKITLQGSFDNETGQLTLDLSLTEGPGGIFASSAGLPGSPPLTFTAKGDGPLGDFSAEIALETEGARRLGGSIRLTDAPRDEGQTTPPDRGFVIDLAGDLQPLFEADYARFFGPQTRLHATGTRGADGATDLTALELTTQGLRLSGTARLAPGGLPRAFDIDAEIGDGERVLLPLSGPKTWVNSARLLARYSAAQSDAFTLQGVVSEFERGGLRAGLAVLTGTGTIAEVFNADGAGGARVTSDLGLSIFGFAHDDPGLARALGASFNADLGLAWRSGDPITLKDIRLVSDDMQLTGNASIDGFDTGYQTTFDAALSARTFARFAPLSGLPGLKGAGTVTAKGSYAPISGAFDLRTKASATGLRTGLPQVDALTIGQSRVVLDAARDATGTTLREAALSSDVTEARAKGRIDAEGGSFSYEARLDNLGRIAPGLNGPSSLSGTATTADDPRRWQIAAEGTGPGGTRAEVAGGITLAPQLLLDLSARGTGPLALANPYLTDMSVQGQLSYDLTVAGPPALTSVSGTASTSGARMSLPDFGEALTAIDATLRLDQGNASFDVSTVPIRGGRITGSGALGLTGSLPADITLVFDNARINDPTLYRTSVSGTLNLTGPIATGGARLSGALTLGRTEILVPSGSIGAGSYDIPAITHIGEPAAVRASRDRAGLIDTGDGGTAGPPIALDVRLAAPNQIFVRGRGLDAELGGALQLSGTTADVVPVGQFDLVRGRLDLLGKRFVLDEGSLALRGTFTPRLRLVATTKTDSATITITLEGPSDDLQVRFTSSPELPEDEILAQLLFGKEITSISPFQAAQLASAVLTLTGKSGEGVVGKLRRNFGLDDFDVTTTDEGTTEVRVGKYLSNNIYSDVTLDSEGQSSIRLNLDIGRNVTARGTLTSEGDTGLGVFYEKDY